MLALRWLYCRVWHRKQQDVRLVKWIYATLHCASWELLSTFFSLSLIFYSMLAWYPPSLCSFLSPLSFFLPSTPFHLPTCFFLLLFPPCTPHTYRTWRWWGFPGRAAELQGRASSPRYTWSVTDWGHDRSAAAEPTGKTESVTSMHCLHTHPCTHTHSWWNLAQRM